MDGSLAAAMLASIHAPARGATRKIRFTPSADVLQSTLPRGERLKWAEAWSCFQRCFNPRSRAGSDHVGGKTYDSSIGFNPRSRAGSDHFIVKTVVKSLLLQSTLPRGERPLVTPSLTHCSRLQSTLPRGERRQQRKGQQGIVRASIHAPARGATIHIFIIPLTIYASIHAPARGATR